MKPSIWVRLADLLTFSVAQTSGAIAVLYPKSAWLMVGVFLMCRGVSLFLRPWQGER